MPLLAWTFGKVLGCAETVIRRTTADGRRVFFDPDEFAWVAALEQNWTAIRKDLDRVLEERDCLPNFQDVSEEQRPITQDDRWKVFVFSVFGTRIEANCTRCPTTARLLDGIPGLCNAMFSILAPGKQIPEHRGPYAGLLRYHLALKVPTPSDACSIRVNDIRRCWTEGKTLIFDDSFLHSVDNGTAGERVVLFADFARPLPRSLGFFNRALLAAMALTPMARRPIERMVDGKR